MSLFIGMAIVVITVSICFYLIVARAMQLLSQESED